MNVINTTDTSTGITGTPWAQYCQFRLPCGLCQKTNMVCPYYTNTIEITCGQEYLPHTINYCEGKT